MQSEVNDELKSAPIDIFSYWQSCYWRNFFYELPIDLNFFPVPYKKINKNFIHRSLVCEENGFYWLVACVQVEQGTWPLIWIPVQIVQNQFVLRTENPVFPWIPSTLFLPSSPIYLQMKALYDDFLKFDCIENGHYCFENFSQFYQACMSLVMQMVRATKTNVDAGKVNFILVDELDLCSLGQKDITRNRLVTQYTRGFEHKSRETISEKNFLNFLHRQFVDSTTETFDGSFHLALLSLLNLKQGDLQAVTAPLGSMKKALIQAYIANLYCMHALDKKEKPKIALLSKNNVRADFQICSMIDENKLLSQCRKVLNTTKINGLNNLCSDIRQQMFKQYEIILKTVRLARNLSILYEEDTKTYGDVRALRLQAQQEAMQLDEQYNAYIEIYEGWQERLKSHSALQKCVGWLSFVKRLRQKKAKDFLNNALAQVSLELDSEQQLIEVIQQLKDTLKENRQQQAQMIEFSSQLESAEIAWEQWVTRLNANYDAKDLSIVGLDTLLKAPRTRMWQLTCLYWQADHLIESERTRQPEVHRATPNVQPCYKTLVPLDLLLQQVEKERDGFLHESSYVEYLIIDDAEQCTASSLLPFMAISQNAILFGDKMGAIHPPLLSSAEDEWILKQKYQQNEEDIEILQILGAALSYADAFTLGLNQSRYHCALSRHLPSQEGIKLKCIKEKDPKIFNYWNKKYHQSGLTLMNSVLPSVSHPSVYFIDVYHEARYEIEGINKLEAEAILNCLQKNPTLHRDCAIVTPFYEQQQLLIKLLSGFEVKIYHFLDLPSKEYNEIIFSPVYTIHSKRPFLFDEGKAYFYTLIGHAKQRLWIVGDRKIFQAHLHSPSGDIAKWLIQEHNNVEHTELVEMV